MVGQLSGTRREWLCSCKHQCHLQIKDKMIRDSYKLKYAIPCLYIIGQKAFALNWKETVRFSVQLFIKIYRFRIVKMSLRSKTRHRAILLLPPWIYTYRSGETVSCTYFHDKGHDLNFLITILPFMRSNI